MRVLTLPGRVLGSDSFTSLILVEDGLNSVLVDLSNVLVGDTKLPRLREKIMVIGYVEQAGVCFVFRSFFSLRLLKHNSFF
jgi:hypothetical protein